MFDSQLSIVMRPRSFDDLVGNDDVVSILKKDLDEGTVSQALMFVGPPGTGKTTLARIIARAAQGFDFPADQEPDVLELNAANFTGVDDMRELVDNSDCYAMRGKYRVVILDEAHMLSKAAQNVLLKPFEAENASTIWIICTTELGKLIKAIRTRCKVYELALLTKKDIHDLVAKAAAHIGCASYLPFEQEAIRRSLNSPRPLLNAFELYAKGMSAAEAVNSQTQAYAPLHKDIAMAVVYGDWNNDREIWGGKVKVKAVRTLLSELEEAFKKKKPADDAAPEHPDVELNESADADEEALSRPEVANGIRAVTAAFLKNMVIKQGSAKAADALYILAHCCPPAAGDMAAAYPATIGGLFRVNRKMNEKS